mmetsp:Transcript_20797/g.44348  ORF Transcript_20797/g.44348 Transcript_20797/m.44348 type:complete len:240 (-) Transcript_20797:161-880(-)
MCPSQTLPIAPRAAPCLRRLCHTQQWQGAGAAGRQLEGPLQDILGVQCWGQRIAAWQSVSEAAGSTGWARCRAAAAIFPIMESLHAGGHALCLHLFLLSLHTSLAEACPHGRWHLGQSSTQHGRWRDWVRANAWRRQLYTLPTLQAICERVPWVGRGIPRAVEISGMPAIPLTAAWNELQRVLWVGGGNFATQCTATAETLQILGDLAKHNWCAPTRRRRLNGSGNACCASSRCGQAGF